MPAEESVTATSVAAPDKAAASAPTDRQPARSAAPLSSWRYVPEGRRDLRFDFLRGYCAFAMVIDHLGGASFLYPFTGGNIFFTSAAEGFIFLSGLMVGFIYGPRITQRGLQEVQMHLLRRALTLYLVTLGLTFTFVGLSRLSGMPWLQDVEPLTPQLAVSLVTLHHTYYLVDVMLLYTLVLVVSPLALLLLHTGRTWIVILLSGGLWLLYQWFPEQTRTPWLIVNNDTFQTTAWQMWFFGGMVIGYHRNRIWNLVGRIPRLPAAVVLTALAAALIWLRVVDGAPLAGLFGTADGQAALDVLFDKHTARPGRVLSFAIFFPLLYMLLTYVWRPLNRALGWLMVPFGQVALYVYALHLFAVYFSALILPYIPGYDRFNALENTPVQILAVAIIWVMVKREILFDVIPR